jgi:hypothetical protein
MVVDHFIFVPAMKPTLPTTIRIFFVKIWLTMVTGDNIIIKESA